jgi:hypothetical protein
MKVIAMEDVVGAAKRSPAGSGELGSVSVRSLGQRYTRRSLSENDGREGADGAVVGIDSDPR